jgi:hypothetical protein
MVQKIPKEPPFVAADLTPGLVKVARKLLKWRQRDLALAARLPLATVLRFERYHAELSAPERLQLVFAFSRQKIRFCRGREPEGRTRFGVQYLRYWEMSRMSTVSQVKQ